ncbi:uncharacterized protein FN964_004966 [Alca torda]
MFPRRPAGKIGSQGKACAGTESGGKKAGSRPLLLTPPGHGSTPPSPNSACAAACMRAMATSLRLCAVIYGSTCWAWRPEMWWCVSGGFFETVCASLVRRKLQCAVSDEPGCSFLGRKKTLLAFTRFSSCPFLEVLCWHLKRGSSLQKISKNLKEMTPEMTSLPETIPRKVIESPAVTLAGQSTRFRVPALACAPWCVLLSADTCEAGHNPHMMEHSVVGGGQHEPCLNHGQRKGRQRKRRVTMWSCKESPCLTQKQLCKTSAMQCLSTAET